MMSWLPSALRSRLVPSLFVVALLAAGCGSDDDAPVSDEAQIQRVHDEYSAALRAGDGAAACKLMTIEARAGVLVGAAFLGDTPKSCADAIKAISEEADEKDFEATILTNITVRGTTATATGGSDDDGGNFARVNGRWLIATTPDEDSDAEGTTTTAQPDTCDELGINREGGRSGRCVREGATVYVADRGRVATITGLRARLVSTRTLSSVAPEFGDPVAPEGRFLEISLELTNTGNAPASFAFAAGLGDANYEPSSDAMFASDSKLTESLGAGLTRRGVMIFDVPAKALAEVQRSGNILIQVNEQEDEFAVLRTYSPSRP